MSTKKPHNYTYASDSAARNNLWQSVDWELGDRNEDLNGE